MKKMPWEEFPHIWKNKTAFMTYLRGCLRKAWSKNPIKHEVCSYGKVEFVFNREGK